MRRRTETPDCLFASERHAAVPSFPASALPWPLRAQLEPISPHLHAASQRGGGRKGRRWTMLRARRRRSSARRRWS
eukprot:7289026-Prymnesium_polylepis.3